MKILKHLALAGACLSAPLSAFASLCDSAYSSFSSGFASSVVNSHPECFGGSPTNAQVQINATSGRQWQAISNALSWRGGLSGPALGYQPGQLQGLAAGEADGAWNLWANLLEEDTRQSYANVFGNRVKNDSDVHNSILGVDYALSSTLVAGVSVAVDSGDISGSNSLVPGQKNKLDSEGFMIAPYLGWQISDLLSLDVSAGVGKGELEVADDDDGSQDSDRWFVGANLNYSRWVGNWQFTGKAGYLHAEEDYEDIRSSFGKIDDSGATSKLDQIHIGAQAGYWLDGFMPYAGLKYVDDVDRSTDLDGVSHDPIGHEAWVWTLGLNYYHLPSGITGGIAFEQEEGRSHQKRDTLMANLSIRL